MASDVAESAGGRLSRLHLLPWHFRLLVGAVIAASLITLALSEFTVRSALNDVDHSNGVLRALATANQLKGLVVDMETGQRGYLLTGDLSYLEPYRTAVSKFEVLSGSLRELFPPGSELRDRLNRIDSLAAQRLEIATTIITLATSGQQDAAVDLVRSGRGRQLMDEIRKDLEAIETQSQAELQVLQVRQRQAALWSRLALLASTAIAIALLILVARQAIDQATAELRLREEAARNSLRMKDIIASRTAELIDLWSHLARVTEREKADLARDIHDELGGLLTAARMDLSWLQTAAAGKEPAVLERLQQLADEITEAMDVKRRVVENLRPALLDHFGLPTALKNHFEETCKRAGLSCTTAVPEEMNKLPNDVSIALFRVGQESLTNIVRHAQARSVHLKIDADSDNLTLVITDDGVGMGPQMGTLHHSHGIRGMRHRIESLGGTFDLQSGLGLGTKVQIQIPLQPPPAPASLAGTAP